MAEKVLSIETLASLDGGAAGAIINAALAGMVADLDDRGDDGQDRSVIVTIKAKKTEGRIEAHVTAKNSLPAYKTHSTIAKVKRKDNQSVLTFQEDSPENPDQQSIPFDGHEKKG